MGAIAEKPDRKMVINMGNEFFPDNVGMTKRTSFNPRERPVGFYIPHY